MNHLKLLTNFKQVDELWDSMCRTAITLISKALNTVDDAELLLKIKGMIALFVQTMDVGAQEGTPRNQKLIVHRAGDIQSLHLILSF